PGYNSFCSGHNHLADGRLVVVGGAQTTNVGLPYASVYDPASNTWTRLPDMKGGRWYPTATVLGNGDLLVAAGFANGTSNVLPQIWQGTLQTWRTLTTAKQDLENYPWLFVTASGKVL